MGDSQVFNPYQGHCYAAADPLVGTDGKRGNVWTLIGNEALYGVAEGEMRVIPLTVAPFAGWPAFMRSSLEYPRPTSPPEITSAPRNMP